MDKSAIETVRTTSEPYLMEVVTYRFRGHSMGDPERYRTQEEVKKWQEDDPIGIFRKQLTAKKTATLKTLDEIDARVEEARLDCAEICDAHSVAAHPPLGISPTGSALLVEIAERLRQPE